MLADMELRGLSRTTQKAYLREVRNFVKLYKKPPEQLGTKEVKEYLHHAVKVRKIALSTLRIYYSALRFLYMVTLKRSWVVDKIPYPKQKEKLPIILDLEEVLKLFEVTENLKHKAVLIVTYSAGLRISETANLIPSDIDSKRILIHVRQGKGSILHTWGQNLMDHPHVHTVVTGGGLSRNGQKWKSSKKDFFLPVKVMSKLFRGKFLDYLKKSRAQNELVYPGAISHLVSPGAFKALTNGLYKKKWVVYCKPPFDGAKGVLEYLGRYTHRIAISNHRIVKMEDDKVSFRWRDYSDNNKSKIMTVDADEFIRRFLLHVLPDRFVKIRHYGLLGNRCRRQKLDRCRELLACADQNKTEQKAETWQEALLRFTGIDINKCPACGEGRMRSVEIILPARCKGPPRT